MNSYNKFFLICFIFLSLNFCLLNANKKFSLSRYSAQRTLLHKMDYSTTVTYNCSASSAIRTICLLCGFDSDIEIDFTYSTTYLGETLLTGTFPDIEPSSFANSMLSDELYSMVNTLGFLDLSLINPEIMIYLGATQAVKFNATVEILGNPGVTFDLLAVKGSAYSAAGSNALAMTAKMDFSVLGTIVEKVASVDISSLLDFISGSYVAVAVCSNDIEFTQISELMPSYLIFIDLGTTLKQGFLVQAHIHFSDSSTVGAFLTKYLGSDAEAYLEILYTGKNLTAFAGVAKMDFGGGLVLDAAGVFLEVSTEGSPKIGLRGKINFPAGDNSLNLQASLVFSSVDIQLEFSLSGVWESAFGVNRFSIGNIVLVGKMTYAGVPSGVQGGAEIAIGLDCYDNSSTFIGSGYCVKAQGYLGLDASNPDKNYYYLNVTALDFDTILRAALGSKTEQKIPVPSIIQNSISFPQGLFYSFSLKPQALASLSLKEGLRAAGTIKIFDVWASLDMVISYTEMKIYINITASPFDFKVVQMKATGSNSGPYLVIDIQLLPPKFSVQMDASITILGMTNAVVVDIDVTKMSFNISGMILGGIFLGSLYVEASTEALKSNSFTIAGSLESNQALLSAIEKVSAGVKDALNSAAAKVKEANSALSNAQSDLEAKKAKTCSDINTVCKKADTCKTSHDECKQYGTKKQCSKTEEQCTGGWSSVCTSTTKTCLGKKKKWWSFICVAWGYVCTATKQVCNGYSAVCTAYSDVVDYSNCVIKNTICDVYNYVIDATCKAACETAALGYTTAQATLEAAKATVTATSASLGALATAADKLTSVSTVFNIKKGTFDLELNLSTSSGISGGFAVNLETVVMGSNKSFSVTFDFANLTNTVNKILDKVLDIIKSMF